MVHSTPTPILYLTCRQPAPTSPMGCTMKWFVERLGEFRLSGLYRPWKSCPHSPESVHALPTKIRRPFLFCPSLSLLCSRVVMELGNQWH